jgi:glycosyltransferase involved in cell wall biosynthesis
MNFKKNKNINNIIILLLLITYLKIEFLGNKFEKQIKRFIKFKKQNDITKYYYEKDLTTIKNYVNSLKEKTFLNINYTFVKYPKVSFIASVYNKKNYLKSFIFSIQNQNLKDFELIFVDDCSIDKSIEIIKKFRKSDKRIKLIENKKNMGSLYSRYEGFRHSKGEFIIFFDSDDIVLKNGILKAYNHIKKNNLDIVQFNSVLEKNNTPFVINKRYYKYYNIIINQPILSYIFYYDEYNNEGNEYNTALWDKIIKREVVFNAFKYIGKQFLNEKISIENDVIILFSLFKMSKSFQYIDEFGYYYFFTNADSITNTRYIPIKSNQIIHSIFTNVKFLYENTGNSYFEKYFCLYKLEQGIIRYKKCFKFLNRGFELIENVINILLESNFISSNNKIKIRKMTKDLFININSII